VDITDVFQDYESVVVLYVFGASASLYRYSLTGTLLQQQRDLLNQFHLLDMSHEKPEKICSD